MSCSTESLIQECKRIEEDCLYTAQAHYQMAQRYERNMKMLIVGPAALAAAFALGATVYPSCPFLGYIAMISSAIAATAASLGMEKAVSSHKQAANLMTALRHQARRLYEVFYCDMSLEEFSAEIKRLCERYDSYVVATETTDNKAFEEARKRIKDGLFKLDQ